MASGLAGVVMPMRVAAALELPAMTKRGIAETRAGSAERMPRSVAGRSSVAIPAPRPRSVLCSSEPPVPRVAALLVDQPETDGAFWAYLAVDIGLGTAALVGARRARRKIV